MKKIIITGANGFVGYWLIKEMSKHDVEILAVIKNENEDIQMLSEFINVRIIYCDLCNILNISDIIPDRDVDVFYHFAWVSAGGKGRSDYSIQLMNTRFSCDAAIAAKYIGCKKILFSGTITEKIAENILNIDVKAENIIYGICKHTVHCLMDVVSKQIGIDYVWMRFSNLYGPYSVNGNIVGYTLAELLKGNDASFGNANQPYDLLYIEDLVHAAYLLGKNTTKTNCYYLGSGNPRILSDFLYEIGNICNKRSNIKIGLRQDDGLEYKMNWFDASAIRKEFGFKPKYSLADGVLNTIKWMEEINNGI